MADENGLSRYPEMRGKVALVTGGSSGIGLATAMAFARERANVVIASRNEKRAQAALRAIGKEGAASWIGCDVASGVEVKNLCSAIEQRHGRLDAAPRYFAYDSGRPGTISRNVQPSAVEAWCSEPARQRI
jgi:enoyl-[acyl-carrier-protein] reductase (NADH)